MIPAPLRSLTALALLFCVCVAAAPAAGEGASSGTVVREWLAGLARRMEEKRDEAKVREEKAQSILRKAEGLLAKARAAGNPAAEAAATRAAGNAREAGTKAAAQRTRAEAVLRALSEARIRSDRAAVGNVILRRSGTVEVRQGDRWEPLSGEAPLLAPGTTVRTGSDGWLLTETPDGSRVKLAPNTELTVEKPPDGWGELDQLLHLGAGMMRARVRKMGHRFEVRTGGGTASVRGTVFRVLRTGEGGAVFEVEEGVVEVTDDGGNGRVEVKAGHRVEVPPGGTPGSPAPLAPGRPAGPWEEEEEE